MSERAAMDEAGLAAVQAAVTLARDRQIRSAPALKAALVQHGCTPEEAGRALVAWGDYERQKAAR